ncbi:MAG: helix-turn-helix domain-containing protein [Phycisphaeraceae bacterium]|nr:helix-turn-helix domain-containing protein [Phycisphaeraceae bacterium]
MAKMEFYSQEEAAAKLGVDEAGLKQMVSRGELQPFRDRDKLLFKRGQVDTLAASDESMGDSIGLSGDSALNSLDDTGTLGNLNLGDTGDLSIAGSDDTGMISLDDSGDTGAISLDGSGGTGIIPLSDTGLDDTGEINTPKDSAGNTSMPLSDTGALSGGSDIGLSATGLGESGLGMQATGTGTGLDDIGLSEIGSGLDVNAAGSGISLSLDDTNFSDDTDDITLAQTDTNMELNLDPKEGSSGLGLALDDLGGSAAGADSLNLKDNPTSHEVENTKQSTGISVFDAGEVDEADPMAATIVTQPGISDDDDLSLDSIGSGSGLLDLTRESDDTSLGAELLDEIYPTGGSAAGESLTDSQMDTAAGSSGVFDGDVTLEASHADASAISSATGNASAMGTAIAEAQVVDDAVAIETIVEAAPANKRAAQTPAGMNMIPAEPFDPAWSGFTSGMLSVAIIALVAIFMVMTSALYGGTSVLIPMIAENSSSLYTYCGGLLGASILFGIIGMVVGPKLAR